MAYDTNAARDAAIYEAHKAGAKPAELAARFYLVEERITQILQFERLRHGEKLIGRRWSR